MKTINQTLKASDGMFGHWNMWTNDIMHWLDNLRITPKRKITVDYTPSVRGWHGKAFACSHMNTHMEEIEYFNEYEIATRYITNPPIIETLEICEDCNLVKPYGLEWGLYE